MKRRGRYGLPPDPTTVGISRFDPGPDNGDTNPDLRLPPTLQRPRTHPLRHRAPVTLTPVLWAHLSSSLWMLDFKTPRGTHGSKLPFIFHTRRGAARTDTWWKFLRAFGFVILKLLNWDRTHKLRVIRPRCFPVSCHISDEQLVSPTFI